jgi:hypothetical protein
MSTQDERTDDAPREAPASSTKTSPGKALVTVGAGALLAGALAFLWSEWSQRNRTDQQLAEKDSFVSAVQRNSPDRVFDLETQPSRGTRSATAARPSTASPR